VLIPGRFFWNRRVKKRAQSKIVVKFTFKVIFKHPFDRKVENIFIEKCNFADNTYNEILTQELDLHESCV